MRVLITGAGGFIARNLVEQLPEKYKITALNSKELNLLDPEYTYKYLKENCFDAVLHTATYEAAPKQSVKDPGKVLENNLRMFFNIARAEDYYGKMIYFGSGAEFSRIHWKPMMSEDYFGSFIPQDQYGFSKYIMTRYALSRKKIINLRLFAVFGKYEDWRVRFISNACCRVIAGLAVKAKENLLFDFLFIDDLVKIVDWFISNTPDRNVYNVCTGKPVEFIKIAEIIFNLSGSKKEIILGKEGKANEYSGDNTLLTKEINGFEFTPIEVAVGKLYNWYLKNQDIIDKEKLIFD